MNFYMNHYISAGWLSWIPFNRIKFIWKDNQSCNELYSELIDRVILFSMLFLFIALPELYLHLFPVLYLLLQLLLYINNCWSKKN